MTALLMMVGVKMMDCATALLLLLFDSSTASRKARGMVRISFPPT